MILNTKIYFNFVIEILLSCDSNLIFFKYYFDYILCFGVKLIPYAKFTLCRKKMLQHNIIIKLHFCDMF